MVKITHSPNQKHGTFSPVSCSMRSRTRTDDRRLWPAHGSISQAIMLHTVFQQGKVTECSRCTPRKPTTAARPSPRISPLCPYGGAGTQSSHFSLSSDTSEVGDVVAMMILGSLRLISISMPTKGQ